MCKEKKSMRAYNITFDWVGVTVEGGVVRVERGGGNDGGRDGWVRGWWWWRLGVDG
jgi:hypothetical protein